MTRQTAISREAPILCPFRTSGIPEALKPDVCRQSATVAESTEGFHHGFCDARFREVGSDNGGLSEPIRLRLVAASSVCRRAVAGDV